MRQTCLLILALLVTWSCSSTPTTEDTPPAEPPPPDGPPTTPIPPGPPQHTNGATDPEQPTEPPAAQPTLQPYHGTTVVATTVDRKTIHCKAATPEATLDMNRRACAVDLVDQLKNPSDIAVVIDVLPGQGCATCLALTAEVATVVTQGAPRVMFVGEKAGTVECQAGSEKMTLAEARKECDERLRKEGGSLRAGIVLPAAIEEKSPCKSCVTISATGYTAKVIAE